MGLVGLTAFLAVMFAFVVRMSASWVESDAGDSLRPVLLGCVAAIAAALSSGVFDHYFFTYPHAFALLWLVCGLGIRATQFEKDQLA
jgi:hypothetical protein